jgi:hypothetical protein
MDSAGVVTYHSPEGALGVRRWVGPKGELVFRGRQMVQLVERATRSHARALPLRVDLENGVQVFGEIDDDRDVATLAGEARSASAA